MPFTQGVAPGWLVSGLWPSAPEEQEWFFERSVWLKASYYPPDTDAGSPAAVHFKML
jgi:hypothetical protein